MTNIVKHLQQNTVRRSHVIQIQLSEQDKMRLEQLAKKYGVRSTRLLYEMFRFCIDLYEKHEEGNV